MSFEELNKLLDNPVFKDKIISNLRFFKQNGITSFSKNSFGQWIIFLKDIDEFVGSIGLLSAEHPYFDRDILPQDQDFIELNFSIILEKRRQGYATEATKSILGYAKNLDLTNRIISLVDEPNIASIKVMENSGMIVYKNQIVSDQKVLFYKVKS